MEKFEIVRPWLKDILTDIKKEIKTELARSNPALFKEIFKSRSINSLTNEEIIEGYQPKILESQELQSWVVSRWVYNNSDIYQFFYDTLVKVNPQVDRIKAIPEDMSREMVERSIENFGEVKTYLFSVFGELAFSQEIFDELKKRALMAREKISEEKKTGSVLSLEQKVAQLEKEISKIEEKHEKKLSAMKKKYFEDMEFFKNQIKKLQQKLTSNA